jgi:acetyl-CoA carboxylase biotin carboxyl carrier protein
MAKGRKPDNGSPTATTPSNDDIVETVRGLAAVVSESALSELIVEMGDARITLRRGAMAPVVMPMPSMPMQSMPMPAMQMSHAPAPAPHANPAAPAAPAAVEEKGHVVTSPFVGTFYRRPNPDSPEYVKLNERVDKGQVLCIVEAMKLMNEIEADVAGTVTAVLAEDGSVVEYGQPLFRIVPA